jgi:phospholipid/cholesterol/gamma-HCH transport system permease protein
VTPASAAPAATASIPWHWSIDPSADGIVLRLSGSWRMQDHLPSPAEVETQLASAPSARQLSFDAREVSAWDTGLLVFILKVLDAGTARGLTVDRAGLPEGVRKLLDLAAAVPERDTKRGVTSQPFLARLGRSAMAAWSGAREMVTFVGEATLALSRAAVGRARFRRVDLMLNIQEAGANALGIVSLISFLIGLILAFVGAIQLRQFGAQIYIADLVAIGMAREMGAMMAAIIMAGRTGAAYAAQLGTMRVNEEIDALSTMGISPFEFLVVPRMLGLILMMPLLTIYANLVGIAGGAVVGVGMLKVGIIPYWNHTWSAATLADFSAGLIKSVVFGVLIAIAGCLRGMQCGRSSAAVGLAATSAVVTGIVFIIVSDAILTVVYDAIGF